MKGITFGIGMGKSGGGGGSDTSAYHPNVVEKSANYTAVNNDIVWVTTGASNITITLPPATANAYITVTKVDSGSGKVIVDGDGAETINGSATQEMTLQDESFVMCSNGTEWRII